MFCRYFFLLCLSTSSLFASSFKLGVTCLVDGKGHIFCLYVDENKPREIISGDLEFKFTVLSYTQKMIAIETMIKRKSAENNVITLVAQPIIITPFDSPTSITCDKLSDSQFKLKLVASKKTAKT